MGFGSDRIENSMEKGDNADFKNVMLVFKFHASQRIIIKSKLFAIFKFHASQRMVINHEVCRLT